MAEEDADKWAEVQDAEAEVDQGVVKEGQEPEDHQVTEACLEAEGKTTSVNCVPQCENYKKLLPHFLTNNS